MKHIFRSHEKQVLAKIHATAANALTEIASDLLREANRTIPIDTHAMEQSGLADVDRTELRATVSYDTDYSVRQHEDTMLNHLPGRRARWLELTAREQEARYHEHFAKRMQGGL